MSIHLMHKRRQQNRQTCPRLNIERLGVTTYRQQLQAALSAGLPDQYPQDIPSSAIMNSWKAIIGHKTRKHQDWYDENDTEINCSVTGNQLPLGVEIMYRFDGLPNININRFRAKGRTTTISITELQNADDNAIVALTEEDLQCPWTAFVKAYKQLGLAINIKKDSNPPSATTKQQ
ncbi:hypothetical protein JOB18_045026 [Solea senegalensis]|uniref:Uncharacterized protein n=1 Tax=Solea senegalensis TaxID=28829 RepID=A0AAV6RFT6_SOLSE|nr:hypothetical protein JOB18_045026 [Solea senegalensis]